MSKKLSFTPYLLISGSVLSNTVLFMSLAVLTLFLVETGFTNKQIGFSVGLMALAASTLALVSWRIARPLGNRFAIFLGMALCSFGYFALANSSTFWSLIASCFTIGFGKSIFEPILKASMSRYPLAGKPELMFRMRYLSICAGAFLGPLAAMAFAEKRAVIFSTSAILICYAVMFFMVFPSDDESENDKSENKNPEFLESHKFVRDRKLIILTLAGGGVFLVFSLFEIIFPLVLNQNFKSATPVFRTLLMTNALLGLILQYPAIILSKKYSTEVLAAWGCYLFGTSFIVFAMAKSSWPTWIFATFIFTCGEALALPASDILIDKISSDKQKAAYFGFGELRQLGFFVGPFAGAFILDELGSTILCVISTIIIALVSIFFLNVFPKKKEFLS